MGWKPAKKGGFIEDATAEGSSPLLSLELFVKLLLFRFCHFPLSSYLYPVEISSKVLPVLFLCYLSF